MVVEVGVRGGRRASTSVGATDGEVTGIETLGEDAVLVECPSRSFFVILLQGGVRVKRINKKSPTF